jgi:hypothetical protein
MSEEATSLCGHPRDDAKLERSGMAGSERGRAVGRFDDRTIYEAPRSTLDTLVRGAPVPRVREKTYAPHDTEARLLQHDHSGALAER